jgi:hypothetical protein
VGRLRHAAVAGAARGTTRGDGQEVDIVEAEALGGPGGQRVVPCGSARAVPWRPPAALKRMLGSGPGLPHLSERSHSAQREVWVVSAPSPSPPWGERRQSQSKPALYTMPLFQRFLLACSTYEGAIL